MNYFDNAATTPCDPRVADFLREFLLTPANPSSVHRGGQEARRHLERAREELAAMLGCAPRHVVFTASATESNNLALRGLAAASPSTMHVITSPIEHSCIRETVTALERERRCRVQRMKVSATGRAVIPAGLEGEDGPGRRPFRLMCLLYAQNETGVVQDLSAARAFKEEHNALWLCDLTQAIALEPVDIGALGIDFASMASHKVYGPPGVGALAGPGVDYLVSQITGGPQENGHRAGTQALGLILGFVMALRLARNEREQRRSHLAQLEQRFLGRLREAQVPFRHNGGDGPRVPGFLNLSFEGIDGPDLVIALDVEGFCVSSGPACSSGVMEASRTLDAMFPGDPRRALGAVRISPSCRTTEEEMLGLAEAIIRILSRRPEKARK